MRELLFRIALVAVLLVTETADAEAFALERVASGLARPVFVTAPPGDFERVFVLEQHAGAIRIVETSDGTLLETPFLQLSGVSTANEGGLLGLAFHPDYASNGFFYVYYTEPDTRVVRYQVSADPDIADASSAVDVIGWNQPQLNHNAGWIGFGPDGLLYVMSGDGGGSDDNDTGHTAGTGNAQDITDNLLGKILRIDVDADAFPADPLRNYAIPATNPFVGVTGDDEIFAYGLRNPWRASFDRATGDLYLGDVGQNAREEVDVLPATSPGGQNYGWRLREGTIATPSGGVGGLHPPGAIDPIFEYLHGDGTGFTGIAITGGVVYRGPITSLTGRYFFADYVTARLWSLVWDGSDESTFDGTNYTDLTDHGLDPAFDPLEGSLDTVTSFGEDAAGNLYVLDLDGEVFRLPEPDALLWGGLLLATLARRATRAQRA